MKEDTGMAQSTTNGEWKALKVQILGELRMRGTANGGLDY